MESMAVPTGLEGLDLLLGGGFKKGSLVVVAGNPGTGKTVFSASWLYHGSVNFNENGIYVSFAEDRQTFIDNMKGFGYDFEKLEAEGKFRFLDLVTVKGGGTSDILNYIVDHVYSLKATRLVIDSFSALAQAMEKPIDIRAVMHTVLTKILRKAGCTTLLIVEIPYGKDKVGFGIEEFLADVVLLLTRKEYDDVMLRELSILKNRWSEIIYPNYVFTLKNGFRVFLPTWIRETEPPIKRIPLVPHKKDILSIGIKDLDKFLNGAFRRGGYNLLEIAKNVTFPIEYLIRPIVHNFLNQGYGVLILPPQGIDASTVRKALIPYVDKRYQENLLIMDYKGGKERSIVVLDGVSLERDMEEIWGITSDLRIKTGKPVLSIIGFDTIEYRYGKREALKILGEDVAQIRSYGDVRLNIVRPHVDIAPQLEALSHVYLKFEMIHGALFVRGIKPRTPLLYQEIITGKDYSEIKLIPVI